MRLIRLALRRRSRRLRAQEGFVILWALAATTIILLASAAAVLAVTNDFPLTTNDTQQKQAYAAAQAGIQRYLFELNASSEYWTQCVPTAQSQNPSTEWVYNTGQTETPQPVPGSANEKYAVMLLPAANQTQYTSCNVNYASQSMIQKSGNNSGTFRIMATGYAGNVKRSLVTSMREQSFLDYSYFSNFETYAPALQVDDSYTTSETGAGNVKPDSSIEPPAQCGGGSCGANYINAVNGASTQCSQYLWAGRMNGNYFSDSVGNYQCALLPFINGDHLNGPFHTNDSVLLCQQVSFGRQGMHDSIEFGGPSPGYSQICGSNSTTPGPTMNGTYSQSQTLQMPQINGLAKIASAAYTYSGVTCLNLGTSGIQVAQPTASAPACSSSGLSWSTVPYPSNGVLYVNGSGASCTATDVNDPQYSGNLGCGTVYVQGTDETGLTIGSANDIVVDGNIVYPNANTSQNGNVMLGLVANGFVRVYHPLQGNGVCQPTASSPTGPNANASGTQTNLTIDAMILSLNDSLVVDNYDCGAPLQTLTVNGGIAQDFRGRVANINGSGGVQSGYSKNYTYDDRLEYEEPPYFPTPVQGTWKIASQTECDTPVNSNPNSPGGCRATS